MRADGMVMRNRMVYGDGVCMLVHVHVQGDVGDVVNMRIVMGHHDLAMMMFAE